MGNGLKLLCTRRVRFKVTVYIHGIPIVWINATVYTQSKNCIYKDVYIYTQSKV